ncbi:MAG: hypothetical protein ACFCUU_18205 [Cyclobacteriaceae bacterium]
MSKKIILADLEKLLFPEYFPYFNKYYCEELQYLQQDDLCEVTLLNIAFKVKTAKYSLEVNDQALRQALKHLFDYHVDHFYDWQCEYEWYELKSILLFFIAFSPLSNIKELEQTIKQEHLKIMFKKYLPKRIDLRATLVN